MGNRVLRAGVLTVLLGLGAACTGDADPGATTPPTTSSTTATGGETTGPEATDGTDDPPKPGFEQPLVIAANIHLPALTLTRAQAQRVIDGDARDWSELGLPAGPLRILGEDGLDVVRQNPRAVAVVPARRMTATVQAASVDSVDPLRQPGRYPFTVPAGRAQPPVTTMRVVGDVMLGRGVAAASPGDPGAALDPLSGLLARADLTVGNLESTLSDDGRARQGDDSFHADPGVVPDLVDAGFDVLSLANNHTGDYGLKALRQTIDRLDRSPIEAVGAGRDAAGAWAPVIVERGGVRFGFLAFNAIGETPRATSSSPGAAEIRMQPRTGPLNAGDLDRMSDAIGRLTDRADVVVVLPHWGDQYTHVAVPDQRRVARALVDAGADLVLGGHPHWVQGIEAAEGGLIAYSLGNFVFDMDFSVPTQEGVLLDLVFWGGRLVAMRPVPYVIGPDYAPRLADGARGHGILDDVWSNSGGAFRR